MLNKLLSLSDLPVSLPKSVRDQLAQAIGSQAVSECPWITLSFIHASYINEHQQEFEKIGISIETLGLMKDLGMKFVRLALYHLIYENPQVRTRGEADHFVQTATQNTPARIAEDLGLPNAAFVGLGVFRDLESNKHSHQRFLSTLGCQLLGAIGICSNYRTLFSLIESSTSTSDKASVPVASYKTMLQEYTQGRRLRQPEYRIVKETGPGHNKSFHVQVHTRGGKWAEGEGSSRKRAEGDAARQYMENFASEYLAKKTRRATSVDAQIRSPHITPGLHQRGVQDLCKLFQVPQDKMWLLSQALVHGSFLNETSLKNVQDNALLAQLGSQVLNAIVLKLVFSKFFAQISFGDEELSPILVAATFCDTSNISKGFDLLKLEELFLVGRGQSQISLSDAIKADALQAVLASLFLAHGTLDTEILLPDKLLHWLTNSIDALVAEPHRILDPKGKLQSQLQAIGMAWKYQVTHQGPEHAQEWEASVRLISHPTKRYFVLKGGIGASQRQAEKHIASLVSGTIENINSRIGILPTNTLLGSKSVRSFATFLLRHEFASAPTSSAAAGKWQREGMLGSQLLAQKRKKRMKEFRFWANAVEALFSEDEGEIPNLERVLAFYKSLAQSASYSRSRHLYREGIAAIRLLLGELDPGKQQSDVRQRHEFSEILSLSKISRSLSRARRKVNLPDIIDGFLLLRQGRFPAVRLTGHCSDSSLSEREGMYQTMLNEVLALLDGDDYDTINLSVTQRPEEMAVDFDFGLPHNLKSIERIQRFVNDSSLWKFLKEEIPIIDINIFPQKINLHCGAYSSGMLNLFAEKALETYHQQEGFSEFENEAITISRFLHDLKNQLIAYQVSLESSGPDRTSQLKSQYEASMHLDTALSILHSLETIGQAMSTPVIEFVDIGEFLRQYVAQKMTTVPSNIRIVPPRTIESCEVWTALEFLHSIIENLVKNSVEAMPDGGEIQIDWVFDRTEKSLLIEVVDNGPGIPDTFLEHLLAGKPIESRKKRGSGIGILAVKTMLRGIGGMISAESVLDKGIHWTVVLPSLEETDESIDLVKADDVKTFVASEEADLQ